MAQQPSRLLNLTIAMPTFYNSSVVKPLIRKKKFDVNFSLPIAKISRKIAEVWRVKGKSVRELLDSWGF